MAFPAILSKYIIRTEWKLFIYAALLCLFLWFDAITFNCFPILRSLHLIGNYVYGIGYDNFMWCLLIFFSSYWRLNQFDWFGTLNATNSPYAFYDCVLINIWPLKTAPPFSERSLMLYTSQWIMQNDTCRQCGTHFFSLVNFLAMFSLLVKIPSKRLTHSLRDCERPTDEWPP